MSDHKSARPAFLPGQRVITREALERMPSQEQVADVTSGQRASAPLTYLLSIQRWHLANPLLLERVSSAQGVVLGPVHNWTAPTPSEGAVYIVAHDIEQQPYHPTLAAYLAQELALDSATGVALGEITPAHAASLLGHAVVQRRREADVARRLASQVEAVMNALDGDPSGIELDLRDAPDFMSDEALEECEAQDEDPWNIVTFALLERLERERDALADCAERLAETQSYALRAQYDRWRGQSKGEE